MRALFWTALPIFVADQALKWYVVVGLDLANRLFLPVFPPYFQLTMAWNRGINFGLFAGHSEVLRWALIAIALAITTWVILWARSEPRNRPMHIAAGILVGGALGNVVDRVVWGAVADFLNVTCCGLTNPWAFNIADICIFIGAFGLILTAGRKPARPENEA